MERKVKVGIAVDAAILDATLALTGEDAPGTACGRAVEAFVQAQTAYRKVVARAFEALTRAFVRTAGIEVPRLPVPAVRLDPFWSWTGEEPVRADELVEAGVADILQTAGVLRPPWPSATNLLAVWGCALGRRALDLPFLEAAALGEFCRSWVYGISCRFGNLDVLVAEAEFAFAGALTGRVSDGVVMWAPERRVLFPPEDAPDDVRAAYRLAWRAVLRLLREARAFRDDGVRLRAEDGRPAALVVLETEARTGDPGGGATA